MSNRNSPSLLVEWGSFIFPFFFLRFFFSVGFLLLFRRMSSGISVVHSTVYHPGPLNRKSMCTLSLRDNTY